MGPGTAPVVDHGRGAAHPAKGVVADVMHRAGSGRSDSHRGCSPSEGFADHTADLAIISVRPSPSYGILWMMSMERPTLRAALTPTSYLVLGLLAREGPSTPYELKRHVAATDRPLLVVPARAPVQGAGPPRRPRAAHRGTRARRAAAAAVHDHAGRSRRPSARGSASPARHPTELRDLALLQLFFADLESTAATLAIAEEQLALHQRQLAGYEADQRLEERPGGRRPGSVPGA